MAHEADLDRFRLAAREWLAANLRRRDPGEAGPTRGGGMHSAEDYLPERALQKKIYEAGYAGINWPAEYAGRGSATTTRGSSRRRPRRTGCPISATPAAPPTARSARRCSGTPHRSS